MRTPETSQHLSYTLTKGCSHQTNNQYQKLKLFLDGLIWVKCISYFQAAYFYTHDFNWCFEKCIHMFQFNSGFQIELRIRKTRLLVFFTSIPKIYRFFLEREVAGCQNSFHSFYDGALTDGFYCPTIHFPDYVGVPFFNLLKKSPISSCVFLFQINTLKPRLRALHWVTWTLRRQRTGRFLIHPAASFQPPSTECHQCMISVPILEEASSFLRR